MFKFFKIRRENKREKLRRHYYGRREACETCKYCYSTDKLRHLYKCLYNDPGFLKKRTLNHICDQYKPERKFKRYLEGKYEPTR